jgi:predicted  nucleic acid-binding Zn-ribbon protein
VLCRPVKIPDHPYLDEVERYPSAVSDSTESCLLEFYEALLSAQDDVKAWSKRLDREVMSSIRRREDIGTKVVRAEKDLVDMRTKLREIRQDIFDEVMRELPGYRYEL